MLDRLVTVAAFQDPVAAQLAKNFLDGNGIPAILLDETTVATDWMLSAAIGGVKLQVAPIHVERAEMLLLQVKEDREEQENEPPVPPTAIASLEAAEDLQAEREDKAEINKLADKLLLSAVFGLIFLPLQLYAIYLMLAILGTEGKVSPKRRKKVWGAILLNMPIMSIIVIPLVILFNILGGKAGTPENPVWERQRVADVPFSVLMPHQPFFSEVRNGHAKVFDWTAYAHSSTFRVTYMPGSAPKNGDLKGATSFFLDPGGILRRDAPVQLGEFTGWEYVADHQKFHERTQIFQRGESLFVISAFGTAEEVVSDEADRYFKSLRLK